VSRTIETSRIRDELNAALYASFPGGSLAAADLEKYFPAFLKALRDRVSFDHELLFVRILELSGRRGGMVGEELVREIAHRALEGGFTAEDTLAAMRLLARVLPAEDEFFERLFTIEALESLRFEMTLDYVTDQRDLGEYLALSYLREGDPETRDVLGGFPISEPVRARIESFFDPERCAQRLCEGWNRWAPSEQRDSLKEWIRGKIPNFDA
jgi:hypothetical protein